MTMVVSVTDDKIDAAQSGIIGQLDAAVRHLNEQVEGQAFSKKDLERFKQKREQIRDARDKLANKAEKAEQDWWQRRVRRKENERQKEIDRLERQAHNTVEQVSCDPEARVGVVRQWALSLCSPRVTPQGEDKVELPPLRPVKEYQPAEFQFDKFDPCKDVFVESNFRAPRVSQLGDPGPPLKQATVSIEATPELTNFVAASNRAARDASKSAHFRLGGIGHGFAVRSGSPDLSALPPDMVTEYITNRKGPGMLPSRPMLLRSRTVARPDDRPVVRGGDPMAGGLFGRDAHIDTVSKSRGVYESQLLAKSSSRRPGLASIQKQALRV